MSADLLATALVALEFPCVVEARGTLAVLMPSGAVTTLADAERRAEIVRAAREHGFTHVALELPRRAAR